ncbi:type III restriction/modification enzyme restriction subunit [Leeuwenhoekiella aestuarii]|uniref:Type III restriction/modification enzyme restriction subunit n=1 Tax=Leeuwenhoekiella aestuarii TaxID=2249426 RepID=A0A4Q0NY76_9FLAO|nr:DEAD/DEAH box helicase family protein [Leeuwenhoekiella aestuarii]RXG17863.1 type III restriction/modification enzyme restriction subunit [Leeuwenhoekiella aestuarii]RXG19192.1 type III restriction/modification enzyme restriction subunit [Leeuwenhoekiella aestuarii]
MSLKSDFAITRHLNFIFPWRSYQAKFLKEFDTHINDGHLHVIAPPGSGKTVLGLEMIRRINRRTLVLCPTLTIRNQWNDRLQNCFLKDRDAVSCSYNLKEPATLTFSTYQSLHAFFKNEMNASSEALINFFKEQDLAHIVLDEAHHLKNEWWIPLFELKKIENGIYTSLTATPPYDSSPRELRNYFDLCGPVDVEITVPELIKENNLCPHQDYIHFSKPSKERIKYIQEYREQLHHFVTALTLDETFIKIVKNHSFYTKTNEVLPDIYENPERYSAILIFLNASGIIISKEKLEVLGLDEKEQEYIPNFSYKWVEILLQHYLIDHREHYLEEEAVLVAIEKKLRQIGGLDQKRVNLIGEQRLYKSLSQSTTKLNSIFEIIKTESEALGSSLRAVILSDYIRKEFLELKKSQLSDLNKLGVIPIFQHLRYSEIAEHDLAVLTGSLIILHSSVIEVLRQRTADGDLTWEQLPDSPYLIIKPNSVSKTKLIGVITSLFEDGFIKILIGTKSLLGEGWDCPAMNTLILASFVGSFVMSNQMRGRAIRVSPKSPDKIASIWHLACLDPTVKNGGADYKLLQRRFEAFCGVTLAGNPVIENGIERLDLDVNADQLSELNEHMVHVAKNRKNVKQRWDEAIESGSVMVNELKLNFDDNKPFAVKRKVAYNSTLKYALSEIVLVLTVVLPELFLSYLRLLIAKGIIHFIVAVAAAMAVTLVPKLYRATKLYLYYGRIDKEIEAIAKVVFDTMVRLKHINTAPDQIKLVIEEPKVGILNCFLKGATEKEEKLFVKYLQEVLAPVNNPRYVINQADWLREKLGFSSCFTVPEIFAQRKKEASVFYEFWKQYLGTSELIFTRNLEGRKLLLKARFNELKKDTHVKTKQATIWK